MEMNKEYLKKRVRRQTLLILSYGATFMLGMLFASLLGWMGG